MAKYVKEVEWIGFVDPREKENEKENKMGKSLEERLEEESTMVAKERDVGKEFASKKRGNGLAGKRKDAEKDSKKETTIMTLDEVMLRQHEQEIFEVYKWQETVGSWSLKEGSKKALKPVKKILQKRERTIKRRMTVNGVILRQHMQEVSKVMSGQR